MLAGIEMCREQHAHLRSLAAELRALLDPEILAQQAAAARVLLSRLGGTLIVHLAMEDRSLYPSLLSCPDATLRETAQRFRDEMGGIRSEFAELTARWPGASAIAGDASGFASQVRAHLAALDERIRREDDELFPLAERSL